VSSQGRRPRPPSFSDVSRDLPCGSGDTRRAAHRPEPSNPGADSPRLRGFSRPRYRMAAPPPSACAEGVLWRRTCTGPWTERRTCPRTRSRRGRFAMGACACCSHADDVPLLSNPRDTPLSPARPPAEEETSTDATDRPRFPFQKLPAKGAVIRETRVPFTVATAGAHEDRSPWLPASASRSRRPHLPLLTGGAWWALQAPHTRGPVQSFESACAFGAR